MINKNNFACKEKKQAGKYLTVVYRLWFIVYDYENPKLKDPNHKQ